MQTLTLRASAKLNLSLFVGKAREDGYHEIRSVMQKISLFDTLEFEKAPRTQLSSDLVYLPADGRNLCVRAVTEYQKLTGVSGGLKITLSKKIPVGSGLGGGSADAAATIRALETLYEPLDETTRFALARSLGADVPFCLSPYNTALCEGIGERITPVNNRLDGEQELILYKEGRKASTARVYAAFDEIPKEDEADRTQALIDALESGDAERFYQNLFNDLTEAVEASGLSVKAHLDKLNRLHARATLMSGAGPTVFAFFAKEDLPAALAAMKKPDVFLVKAHFLR